MSLATSYLLLHLFIHAHVNRAANTRAHLLKVNIIVQFLSPLKGEGELFRSKALVSGGSICLSQHAAGGRHGCGGDAAAAHVVGCPR